MEIGFHIPPRVKRLDIGAVNRRQRHMAKHGVKIDEDSELNSISHDDEYN